mmetsp:Transcript_15688/g.39858  ORF Transcript_15688/g.39858 Transcript_15688/m.39858 type:complete len:488 (+) Transcript_15688:28-1491(+)
MFLSKDVFEDVGAAGPETKLLATPTSSGLGAIGSRPQSAARRPQSSASGRTSLADDEPEQEAMTAASMKEKMMRQRELMLRKSANRNTGGGMIMSNTAQADFAAAPPGQQSGRPASMNGPMGSGSGLLSSSSAWSTGQGSRPGTAIGSNSTPSTGVPAPSMGVGPKPQQSEKQVEEARRESVENDAAAEARQKKLTQQLEDVGIMPVFDPCPNPSSTGPQSIFDMRTYDGDRRDFLMNPAPKGFTVECRITRDRSGLNKFYPKYIVETEQGDFLMSSKKRTHNKTSNYLISMSKTEASKMSDSYLGKLRSNFLGSEFVAYGPGMNPEKLDKNAPLSELANVREELAAVSYTSTLWGKKPHGPRKMEVAIPFVEPRGQRIVCRALDEADGLLALAKSGQATGRVACYQNKAPKWNDQIGAFVLNFNKRVTQASVKNFQLISTEDSDTVYLQYGRVGKDTFTMDYRWPLSAFQAFSICLSSFDYKLCCE